MKIYLVSVQYTGSISGSGGVYVVELSYELAKKGYDVSVVAMGIGNSPEYEEIEVGKNKIKVYRLWTKDSKKIKGPFEGNKKEEIQRLKDFSRNVLGFFSSENIDEKDTVIHLFGHYMVPSLAKELKKIKKYKILSTIYALESISEARKGNDSAGGRDLIKFIQKKEREAFVANDFIFVRSNTVKEELSWMLPDIYDESKVAIMSGGISDAFIAKNKLSVEYMEYVKRKFYINGELILNINRIDPAKGLEYIISAYKSAVESYTQPITLVIAGWLEDKNKWYYERLLKQIKKIKNRKIRDSIKIHINLTPEEKLALYNLATLTVFGYIVTPFSISLVESILKGVPFISPGIESVLDILNVDKVEQPYSILPGGILVYYLNPLKREEFLKESLKIGLAKKEELKTGLKIVQRQMKRYLWSENIKILINVYKKLLK